MSEQEAHDLIRKQVTSNDIVLFVKGTKQSSVKNLKAIEWAG